MESTSVGGTVGIDFGTTNSSIAFAQGGRVEQVTFSSVSGISASWRSLLFLQQQAHAGKRQVSVWTGAEAVARYLESDSFDEAVQGRLIQSLKSHLAARNLTGTEIFGRQYRFEELVARILRDLRQRASEFLGFPVTQALAGRPVVFVGADTEDDNAFAEARLRESFLEAGFLDVQFAMEPVAAAFAYESNATRDETLLIGDFGGGTTDFSLLRTQPHRGHSTHAGAGPKVLGNSGVALAGDALDARIVRRLISPALGSDSLAQSLGKTLPALPAWVYSRLEHWHTLSFLRTRAVRDMLRVAGKQALEPEKIAALNTVVAHDLGYRLHQAVQRLKIELSQNTEAEFALHTEALTLRTRVERSEFERWIAPELEKMAAGLDALLASTGTSPGEVDRVFLTGGTSLVPAVRRLFTERFGEERVQQGEAFTSVAQGLALMAHAQR